MIAAHNQAEFEHKKKKKSNSLNWDNNRNPISKMVRKTWMSTTKQPQIWPRRREYKQY
jgi:hypothetical protein